MFYFFLFLGIGAPVPEFAQLCARLLGPMWEHVASIFAIGAVLGACIVYWVLMSTFLYDSVDFISGKIALDFLSCFSYILSINRADNWSDFEQQDSTIE